MSSWQEALDEVNGLVAEALMHDQADPEAATGRADQAMERAIRWIAEHGIDMQCQHLARAALHGLDDRVGPRW